MAHLIRRSKSAKGRTYTTWLWRSKRRHPDDWRQVQNFDIELGDSLSGLRTRTLVALGELSAADLVTDSVRYWFHSNGWIKHGHIGPFTGIKDMKKPLAWWVSFPARSGAGGKVKIVMRSRRGSGPGYDMRHMRTVIRRRSELAHATWQRLTDDPIVRLAQLRWFESEAERETAEIQDDLIELRRALKRGDLSQRDYDADERDAQRRLQNWEDLLSTVRTRWDEQEQAIRDALPRTTRDQQMSQVIAKAEKLQSDPKQLNAWRSEHWQENTLHGG